MIYIIAFLIGLASTSCFAPIAYGGWFQPIILSVLFALLIKTPTWKKASFVGFTFALGNFLSGISWIYVSVHHYGGMQPIIASLAVIVFSIYLSLFSAFACGLWRFLVPFSSVSEKHALSYFSILTFASAWCLSEWLRGTLLTGFPWLAVGYAQTDGPFSGYAPLIGVYGISWIVMICSGIIFKLAKQTFFFSKKPQKRRFSILFIFIAFIFVAHTLAHIQWTTSLKKPLSVRLIQGNVDQSLKIHQQQNEATLAKYQQLITTQPADLIITPESALPTVNTQLADDFKTTIQQFLDQNQTTLLFGVLSAKQNPDQTFSFQNSAFGLSPSTIVPYEYHKHHLVPFGEYIPFGFQWFMDLMHIPLSNLSPGQAIQPPLIIKGQGVMPDICYEDLFGEQIARSVRFHAQYANILVNMTNLAWFGHSLALPQHLQIARMRSLETGRPMLTITNNGITAIINTKGQITRQLEPFTTGSLSDVISGYTGLTPYISNGNISILVISLLILIIAFAVQAKPHRN